MTSASKHLLMIVPFFPPNAGGGVHRALSFVKYLVKFGWRTTVIAPRPDAYWLRDESLSDEVPESTTVCRTNTLAGQFLLPGVRSGRQVRSTRGFSVLRRLGALALIPDTYIGWYPFAVRQARRVARAERPDALYSTSPPETSHVIARAVHGATGLPWVADFRDPWMNLHLLKTPTPLHRRCHERLERSVCTRAAVVVTNKWHAELLRSRYPGAQVRIITNGFEHEKVEHVLQLEPPGSVFSILHAGMLTQRRSAAPFLRALRLFLDRHPDARVQVSFIGPRESGNEQLVTRLELGETVRFEDSVPHEESLARQRRAHVLLLIKNLERVYAGIVPGKLYEYLGVRRPILALVPDGEVKEVVTNLRRGEVADPGDVAAIAERISLLYGHYRLGTLEAQYDLSPVPQYHREALAGELAEYLESIVAKKVR